MLNRRAFIRTAAGAIAYAQMRPRPQAIDVHAHYFPERFLKNLADEGSAPGFEVDFSNPTQPVLVQGPVRTPLDVTYWKLEKRVERMNAQGVQVHALSLTLPMVHWAPPARGAALARIVNDSMIEAHATFPERFVGCAALPIQAPGLAVKELDRISGQSAIRGVYLPTSFGDRNLSDPSLFPIYERCEALNLPVLLHPVTPIGADRLQQYYLRNLLGNPYDTGVAAAFLIFGGVLDRFPRLNFVLPHAGGTLPYVVGRLEHGQAVRPEVKNAATHPAGEYLRRFHFDTITHSPQLLRFLIDFVGSDRVVLGSDYCFDMGDDHPVDTVANLNLKSTDRENILFANAKRLFRM